MKYFRLFAFWLPVGFLLLSSLLSCSSSSSTSSSQAPKTSGLLLANMDSTVKPGDNFFEYVNGTWMKKTEIPSDKSSYGIALIIYEELQDRVKGIIESAAESNSPEGSDEQKIGDLFAAFTDMETRNKRGLTPIQAPLAEIDAISSYEELMAYFGTNQKLGYANPLRSMVMVDLKAPTQYAAYLNQSGLGLPDREFYLSDGDKYPEIRQAYRAHLEEMFSLAKIDNAAAQADKVLALETQIATHHWKKEETRNAANQYHLFSMDSLESEYPALGWKDFFSGTGLGELPSIIVRQPSFFAGMNELLPNTDLESWKSYLRWGLIDSEASYLTEEINKQNFSFFGTTLSGTPEQQPLWRRGVGVVNGSLGELVGKVYVKRHFPPAAKVRMSELVDNLLEAYRISIEELDWMSEETKKEALDKLAKFTPKIGYPDEWKDYSAVNIKSDQLVESIRSSRVAGYERNIGKLGQPIDKTEWGLSPQTLNAYYNPAQNEIVFPAAILQPPFFDMNADDAVNYGSIGAVIGHEIGHGFDDQGSTFDGDGSLRNWWTDADREEFSKRTAGLIEQYNGYEVLDDLFVNGTFTLGENIGDLGGLSIGLKAYQLSLDGKEAPVLDGFTGLQRVFLGWGQIYNKISRPEALRLQINTDPHSPSEFRVNGIVRNVPEFYEAFDIQPTDSLYLAPAERIKIW